jgi:glycosyltransferase involved in cell wall biosynthesis
MNIGFYNPYFDSLSGGERYVLTLASHWSKAHDVSIFWNDTIILKKSQDRFHIDLSEVKVTPNIFQNESFVKKLFITSRYDLIFFLSDGSIPTTCARKNILHFQVPFSRISFPFWKKIMYQKIICNSSFTQRTIDERVGRNANVIYPPVDVDCFRVGKKEKVILSVGRFSSFFQTKKQEILIDIFTEGVKRGLLRDWKLILAGGLLESDQEYVKLLKKKSNGLAIEFLPNISFDALRDLYAKATFYWHAAGFGESDPTLMEHFGITTVESMASGCIPIVYNAGGQPEIVVHGKNGYVWDTKDECLKYTIDVIRSETLRNKLLSQSAITANKYSSEVFCRRFDEALNKIVKGY